MSGEWKVSGMSFGTATTHVDLEEQRQSTEARTAGEAIHGGGEYVESLGNNKPRVPMQFFFLGSGTEKHTLAEQMAGLMENSPTFTVEAPADQYIYAYRTVKHARFKLEGNVEIQVDSASRLTLRCTGIFLGDADATPEQSRLEVEFLENDFYTATDDADYSDGVLIGVPVQKGGYPKGQNVTTGVYEVLTLIGAEIGVNSDGSNAIVETYDLTGYVAGEPHDDGDGGPASLQTFTDQDLIDEYAEASLFYVNVTTLPNDFSITESSSGFLMAADDDTDIEALYGPSATVNLVSEETGVASDGSTATVRIYEITGNDGTYILKEAT